MRYQKCERCANKGQLRQQLGYIKTKRRHRALELINLKIVPTKTELKKLRSRSSFRKSTGKVTDNVDLQKCVGERKIIFSKKHCLI